jgi:hypothetical protein
MGGAVMKAVQAIGIEEKEEVRKPVLAGEVEKSIALGRSGLIRNQKKAAVNLFRLSKDSDRVRNQIVDEGGILPLIQMCRSKSQEVQLLAFGCMGQLALTRSNRCESIGWRPDWRCVCVHTALRADRHSGTKMLESGAVAPLLEGLKHKKYDVRSASVFALGGSRTGAARGRCFARRRRSRVCLHCTARRSTDSLRNSARKYG